jgi:hypothetical protein
MNSEGRMAASDINFEGSSVMSAKIEVSAMQLAELINALVFPDADHVDFNPRDIRSIHPRSILGVALTTCAVINGGTSGSSLASSGSTHGPGIGPPRYDPWETYVNNLLKGEIELPAFLSAGSPLSTWKIPPALLPTCLAVAGAQFQRAAGMIGPAAAICARLSEKLSRSAGMVVS